MSDHNNTLYLNSVKYQPYKWGGQEKRPDLSVYTPLYSCDKSGKLSVGIHSVLNCGNTPLSICESTFGKTNQNTYIVTVAISRCCERVSYKDH